MLNRKIRSIIYITLIVVFSCACTNKKENELSLKIQSNNNIMTEEFFKGLKQIKNIYHKKVITESDKLNEICNLLAGLTLTDAELPKEVIFGSMPLVLTYEDGTEKHISLQGELLICDGSVYSVDKNIIDEISLYFSDEQKE